MPKHIILYCYTILVSCQPDYITPDILSANLQQCYWPLDPEQLEGKDDGDVLLDTKRGIVSESTSNKRDQFEYDEKYVGLTKRCA